MSIIFLLSFSSGLPLALVGSTLQAWFAASNISVINIGLLSLVGQPYVYKFIWAPLLDRYTPPFLGRRRGWIVITQLGLILGIITMSFFEPKTSPWLLASLALLVAFFSASQDISIDAYRTELLTAEERGFGAAVVVTGYRIAILISGGLSLMLAATIGWKWTYTVMAILIAFGLLAAYLGPEPAVASFSTPTSLRAAVLEPFREFMSRERMLAILLLIILYKLSDAFAGALTVTFLLQGMHFSLIDIGTINKALGMIATILGAIIGGSLTVKIGLFRALLAFGILQALSVFMLMLLAIVGKNYVIMVIAIFMENFCGGLGTAAFLAFIMSLCDKRYTATQYALLSAFSAIGRVFIGPIAGLMVHVLGWSQFYFWTAIIALPSLLLIIKLRRRIEFFENNSRILSQF